MNIHFPEDDKIVVFGNVSDKDRLLVTDGDDNRFITDIGWTLARGQLLGRCCH